ncbi:hypothetical protein [Parvularcula oceani]|uniref:hypothetical protein n=1 Tax=Parvularcula oceani TaxID=1247963 RepID=UPI0004E1E1E8|nr:hypothetical protein [Parvularcula oceani]
MTAPATRPVARLFPQKDRPRNAFIQEPPAQKTPDNRHVLIDEDLHLAYSANLRRHRWEDATMTFRSVLVTGGGRPPRRYGADDPWEEDGLADPRCGYTRVGNRLKRHSEAGRDYDPARHLQPGR